ncbi:MAG: carbon-nitrogen hydrolase family protein [Saprospiraceae bacterium]|nr:carbon-nitrogen hydrolase family protein [Saprospiraceae bacterium]
MNHAKVAIVQQGPVYLDRVGSLEKATSILHEAGQRGCNLIVFGESWFSGYPVWLDCYQNVAIWDHPEIKKVFALMLQNSISIPGEETKVFQGLAEKYGMAIVLGCNERVHGTIYNTALIFDEEGKLACHHRKLMPTYTEKMVYGLGDGRGLHAVDTSFGKLTTAICWEHFMPLTRQALHDSGETIHVALWPRVHEMLQVASRQYAFEGRCFTVAAGQMVHHTSMPRELGEPQLARPWLLNGGSSIYAPDGSCLLAPQFDRDEVIYFEVKDLEMAQRESMTLDVSGHYARKDVFRFEVDRRRTE